MSYQPENPAAFLEEQGWPFKRQGQELVTGCPFCGETEGRGHHLHLHQERGVWRCAKCGEAGNLWQLRQRLGLGNGRRDGLQSLGQALRAPAPKRIPKAQVEAMHAALLADPEAMAYATETRRWSLDVVKRFTLGLRVDGRGKWLAYPWWRRGECVGMKYRILPAYLPNYPQRFDREPGCESVLFNVDAMAAHDEIILATGESDLLALLTLGIENVVATTTGESSLPASAVAALSRKARVLIPFDSDAAGQKGAREIGKRIGFDRTWLVRLPAGVKDVGEFVEQGGTREAFEVLLAQAVQFDIPTIRNVAQALDALEEASTLGAWDRIADTTPWPSVNRRLGVWHPGDLIIVGAPFGTGKTTFLLNIAAHWAQRGFPVLVYCLEMPISTLMAKIVRAHYGCPVPDEGDIETIPSEVLAQARQDLVEWPLFLGSDPRLEDRKDTLDLLRQAVRRFGVRLVIFDNLNFLARSLEHRHEEVGLVSKAFKRFAMEMEIPVALVAQPRKMQPGQIMTAWDLKDSADVPADGDQVILLHRDRLASTHGPAAVQAATTGAANYSPLTVVRLEKGRVRASKDATLYCVGAEQRFRELGPNDMPERTNGHHAAASLPYKDQDE